MEPQIRSREVDPNKMLDLIRLQTYLERRRDGGELYMRFCFDV